MKRTSRSICLINLVATAAVCFGFLSTALADTLTATEIQATNSPDTELRPSLGDDLGNGIASLVVYSAFDATNKATVEYQRITDNGPVPGGHLVVSVLSNTGERLTDDELNDTSGDLIVYTAFRADGAAQIRSYRISDGTTNFLSSSPNTYIAVGQAKIHGNNVVWIAQVGGVTVIVLSDANGAQAAIISDGAASAGQLEIGDTFVVWSQGGNVLAYDLRDGSTSIVASSAVASSASSPSTSGSWVVWETGADIFALDLDSSDLRQVTSDSLNINPSIDAGMIAWESFAAGNFDIYLHRLSDSSTYQLTTNPSDQQLNSIFGNKVAYLDDRNDIGDGALEIEIFVSTFSIAADPGPDPEPDPTPDITWLHQFGVPSADGARGIARGSNPTTFAREVYVAGNTVGSTGGFVRKYDADGNVLWASFLGTPAFVEGVTFKFGVYVVGTATAGALPGQTSAGASDAFVRKYDRFGTELWTRQFGTSAADNGRAIAFDSRGDVYVAGSTSGTFSGQTSAGNSDAFVRKYDSNGNHLWTQQFGSASFDRANAITIQNDESARFVYVAGQTGNEAFVRKLNDNGTDVWTRQFGPASGAIANSVVFDESNGGLYVAGYTFGTLPGGASAGGTDGFLRKYNANGDVEFTRHVGTSAFDRVFGISVDASGVTVAGQTAGTFPGQTSAGDFDAFVRRYDVDGAEVFTFQFGTPEFDMAFGIVADSPAVYVAGETQGTFPGEVNAGGTECELFPGEACVDAFVVKLTPPSEFDVDGDGIFNDVDTEPNSASSAFSDVALGGTTVGDIDISGGLRLTITEEQNPAGVRITADPAGDVSSASVIGCPVESPVTINLDSGDEVVLTCSSAHVDVIAGIVDLVFIALDGGLLKASVGEGNGLIFDATTSSITAPFSNSAIINVSVGGIEVPIVPGQNFMVVDIDIKPWRFPNSIYPPFGLISVAILGSEAFDVDHSMTGVNAATLGFGPAGGAAFPWVFRGFDINHDNFNDLIVIFRASRSGIECGDTEAMLAGRTYSGDSFLGTDSIVTVGCF